VDDPYEALRQAIGHLRAQLAFLARDDPHRDQLYRDLLWCYHEAFALLKQRSAARRAANDWPDGQQTARTPGGERSSPGAAQPHARCAGPSSLAPTAPLSDA
jgi:hypothetical protein